MLQLLKTALHFANLSSSTFGYELVLFLYLLLEKNYYGLLRAFLITFLLVHYRVKCSPYLERVDAKCLIKRDILWDPLGASADSEIGLFVFFIIHRSRSSDGLQNKSKRGLQRVMLLLWKLRQQVGIAAAWLFSVFYITISHCTFRTFLDSQSQQSGVASGRRNKPVRKMEEEVFSNPVWVILYTVGVIALFYHFVSPKLPKALTFITSVD